MIMIDDWFTVLYRGYCWHGFYCISISNVTSLPVFTANSVITEHYQTGSVMKHILCITCVHTEESFLCVCIHTYIRRNTPIMCFECLKFYVQSMLLYIGTLDGIMWLLGSPCSTHHTIPASQEPPSTKYIHGMSIFHFPMITSFHASYYGCWDCCCGHIPTIGAPSGLFPVAPGHITCQTLVGNLSGHTFAVVMCGVMK